MAKASFELDLAAFRDRLAKIESRIAEVAGNRSCPQIVVVSKYLSADDCSTLRGTWTVCVKYLHETFNMFSMPMNALLW